MFSILYYGILFRKSILQIYIYIYVVVKENLEALEKKTYINIFTLISPKSGFC